MNGLYPCHHGHCVHETIGQWQRWLKNEIDNYLQKKNHFINFIVKILFCYDFWWAFIWENKYFYIICPYEEAYLHTSFLNIFVTSFPVMLLLRSDHLAIEYSPWISHTSGHFSFQQNVLCPKFFPLWSFSSPLYFSCSCSLVGGAYIMWRIICKPGPSLQFIW